MLKPSGKALGDIAGIDINLSNKGMAKTLSNKEIAITRIYKMKLKIFKLTIYILLFCKIIFAQINLTENVLVKLDKNKQNIVTVDFKNLPIEDVLRVLALQQNINIVKNRDVTGNVTMHLNELVFPTALKFIVNSIGADCKMLDDVYHVFKKGKDLKNGFIGEESNDDSYLLKLKDDKVDLIAFNVDIRGILQNIAEKAGLNIVLDDSVQGKVSVNVKQVFIMDVLFSLIETNEYYFEKTNDVYRITKRKKKNYTLSYDSKKIFIESKGGNLKNILTDLSLNTGLNILTCGYVSAKIDCRLMHTDPEKILQALLIGTEYQYKKVDNVFIIGNANSLDLNSLLISGNKIIPLKHIRVEQVIKTLPPAFPEKNIKVISQQNAISVYGSDSLIKGLENFIKKIDKPHPQINIEVLVVEYKENTDKTFGLSLQDVKAMGFGSNATNVSFNPGTLTPFNFTYNLAQSLSKSFKFYLQALVESGKAKICAKPNVSTLSGREANISVLTKDRYRSHRYNAMTNTLEPLGEPSEIETGVKLKIKPWLSGDGHITVEVEPEVSETTGNFSSDNLPQTNERKAKTIIRIESGKTIIIGGLIQSTYDNTSSRVPYLSRIPLLGKVFRRDAKEEVRTELVFYITPRIGEREMTGDRGQMTEGGGIKNIDPAQILKNIEIDKVKKTAKERWFIERFKRLLGAETNKDKARKQMKKLSEQVEKFGWDSALKIGVDSGYDVKIIEEKKQYVNEPLPEDNKYMDLPEYRDLDKVVDDILFKENAQW